MKILIAEYASALGMGGTCELEGWAMLSALAFSFWRCGHDIVYPTSRQRIGIGHAIHLRRQERFVDFLDSIDSDAGLLIAPDELQPDLLVVMEDKTVNLGCSPLVASLCADKLYCSQELKNNNVPVAEVVTGRESSEKGCHRYVIKPRSGCGSEGIRISSYSKAPDGYIATRFYEGVHLSASFIVGEKFLPLTINRQLIKFEADGISYNGSQVPYRTPRAAEIWETSEKAAKVLKLKGYAGIDFVVSDLPRVVDVNARPTTSIVGITKVIKQELADLILRARFGGMPEEVEVNGDYIFRKEELRGYPSEI
ncbi:MAG: ATP-grasp domain-containing protein [Methanotrichaceae archaeon]|nr:ATP-grasp domain-containing protein [Methanotrichaceae archaeon]